MLSSERAYASDLSLVRELHIPAARGHHTGPPPPTPPNGDATPVQLKSLPQGDEPSGAVKVEGLMDASESPLKV